MNSGTWTNEEHRRFLSGIARYGNNWKEVVKLIPTRTVCQVRTHAQKYYLKIEKDKKKAELYGSSLPSKNEKPIALRKRPPIDYVRLNGDSEDVADAPLPSPKRRVSRKRRSECVVSPPLQDLPCEGKGMPLFYKGKGMPSYYDRPRVSSYHNGQWISQYAGQWISSQYDGDVFANPDRQTIPSSPPILNRSSPSSSFSEDSSGSTLPLMMIPPSVPMTVQTNPYAYPHVLFIPYAPIWPGTYRL